MKKIILSLAAASLLGACTPKDQYTVTARLKGVEEGAKAYLSAFDRESRSFVHRDSAVVEDGALTFEGKAQKIEELFIMISKEKRQFVPFLLDNSSISVEGHVDSLWLAKVAGGANDQLAEAKVIAKSNSEELKQLETEYREASQNNDHKAVEAVIERYNASEKAQADKLVDYIKAHSKSKAAPYIFAQLIQPKTRDNHKLWKKVIAMMDTSLHSNPKIVQTSERIKLLESLSEGQIAPEFSQNDKDGKPVKLSSFRGKPLLIDFWASWCGPCRRANPKVVATYKKYKDQGFQVLGVSLDENKEKWLQAVEKDGLVWTHVSDLKGWGNEAAKLYGVQSIPHTVLIDAEGRIAGKNLHGEELEKKIEELLPNS